MPTTLPCQFTNIVHDDVTCQNPALNSDPVTSASVPNTVSETATMPNTADQNTNSSSTSQHVAPPRRSSRHHTMPTKLKYFVLTHTSKANQVSQTPLFHEFQTFMTAHLAQIDPKSFKEAVKQPGWCKAMDNELRALEEHGNCSQNCSR